MASKCMNVLVYSGGLTKNAWWDNEDLILSPGNGSTVESVRHCIYTLRRLLAPNYAVIPVTGDMLIKEPWTATCAVLVVPGGADQGYCRTLNGEGNRRIRQFVERGGGYIGFCAGGYYGSQRCEFEVGDKILEVIGNRELAFFPGIARGCAFPGFVYHSEKGARAAEIKVDTTFLSAGSVPNVFKSYYNGGGVFVDAPKYKQQGIEVLASYTEKMAVESGEGAAAIVYCKVGEGAALLTGPHPEFAAINLEKKEAVPGFDSVVDILADDEKHRMEFLKACLTKLGLKVSEEQNVPSLSRIHLSSITPLETSELLSSWNEIIINEGGEEYIKDEIDTFHIVKPSTWKMGSLIKALPSTSREKTDKVDGSGEDRIVDYSTILKEILAHEDDYPASKETPYFNHHAFYSNFKHYQQYTAEDPSDFGRHLLYGEVVTSTNTMLEKNTNLLRHLPTGFTATATVQVAGRGRGSNVWVSPPGSLMFSTVIRHPMSMMSSAPVVFIQYLAAMAIVQAVKSYDGNKYRDMPVKLKWPNDIFALDPSAPKVCEDVPLEKAYTKIGGILVNSHYNSSEYIAVCGIGLNTGNKAPTTSLNALLPDKSLPHFTLEKLLARILTCFESLYSRFLRIGFDRDLEEMYYQNWLHMDQVVTLEAEGGMKARIKGITRDYGLLVAEEISEWDGRTTGRTCTLQSDSNSFDFFKGLVKRKL